MTTENASLQILNLIRGNKDKLGKGRTFTFYIARNDINILSLSFDTSLSDGDAVIFVLQDEGQIESLGQIDIAEFLVRQSPHYFEPWKQPLCYYERRIKKIYEKSGIGDKGYLTWDEINMLQMVFKKHLVSQCVEHWKTGENHFWMDVDKYDIYAESVINYNYAVFYGQSTDIHDKKKELVRFKDGELEKVYFDHNESNTMTVINALQEWIDNPPQDKNRSI